MIHVDSRSSRKKMSYVKKKLFLAGSFFLTLTLTGGMSIAQSDTQPPVIYLKGSKMLPGITGPSSTQSPYLKPNKPGISFTSIASVNDVINGYRMVGIPDGMGAYDNFDGTFTLLLNHELTNTVGIPRAHGSKGAFISKWVIRKSDLSVVSVADLMNQVYLWNPTTSSYVAGTIAFSRFCSADLPAVSAFYNAATGLGTQARIFMNGEESGNEGRGLGHIATGPAAGVTYDLPRLGKFSWENAVASPATGNKTIVAGMDDGTGGQVYVYVGTKTNTGSDVDKAGLTNGKLYGVKITGLPLEVNGSVPAVGTRFEMADLGNVENITGTELNTNSVAAGVTTFMRPEDGAWDPSKLTDLYFATTNAFNSPTRLWRLRFDDIANPEAGGVVEAVLDGTEGGQMFDNITIDKKGQVMLVEDVGNNVHIGKVWQYNIASDSLFPIAYHDSTRFLIGAPQFLTQDEEASGVLDVSEILGPGMALVDVQAHFAPSANTTEVVEGGQLLAFFNPYLLGNSTANDTLRITLEQGCTATVDLGTPATGDNVGVISLTNNAPAIFPVDTTIVTWTATDAQGNTATAQQVVIVTDNSAPAITAPASLSINAGGNCAATGVNLGTPVVTDNCEVVVTNNAPIIFPMGTTTVTWTATDANGNTATTTQTVTVSDTTKPLIYFQPAGMLAGITGPNSTQSPYLKPNKPGIQFTSIASVNDVVNGYRMVGIPDGMGAFDNYDGTFTLFLNHELTNTVGIPRAHGSKGAFISKWVIRKSDLSVVNVADLMNQVYLWNPTTSSYVAGTIAFSRFCSADLPAVSAFYNPATGLGTQARIFMNGEESGNEGRGLGHIATGAAAGVTYDLPRLGKFSWENAVASPAAGNKTIVAGMDDGTGGQVYVYVGTKTNTGSDVDKAGLTNGKLYGVKIPGLPLEVNGSVPAVGTRFEMADLGNVENITGTELNTNSVAAGVTTFMRPEDGAWDPSKLTDLYFATTNAFNSPTRLWRLRFDDIANPEAGGVVEAVLDGTEGGQMFDNITIDKKGQVMLVEDVGNNVHIGKVWQYNIASDSLFPIAYHDSTRFLIGAPQFLTQDEEASGVLDVSEILGPGMALVDVQAHFAPSANTTEVVEGGQLLAFFNPYLIGTSAARDTVRVSITSGNSTVVDLGTPLAADNCGIGNLTNNAPAQFPIGTTLVTWTATDANGNVATAQQVVIVAFEGNQQPIVNLTNPTSGSNFDAGNTITADVEASDPDGNIVKVELYVNGTKFGVDSIGPYKFTTPQAEAGNYAVYAKAFDNAGDSVLSDTIHITVAACTPTGSISAFGYTNINGATVADLTGNPAYPEHPSIIGQLDRLEYSAIGDNYGGRLRGYICAPETGNYTFYIAADDQAGLWLSPDDNPDHKALIAYAASYTGFRAWFATPTQKSASVYLVKGARYYIETLHKDATSTDHLSVAWVLPSGVFEAPIKGNRLSVFGTSLTSRGFEQSMRNVATPAADSLEVKSLIVTVSPNPSQSAFTVRTRSNSNELLSVSIVNTSGVVVERKTGVTANGFIQLGEKLNTGVYIIEVIQGNKRERIKVVKQ